MSAPLTPATLQILITLMDGPVHGYAIKRDVESRTSGAVRLGAGTLYTGLHRMETAGLIEETEAPVDRQDEAGSRWRFYRITARGEALLRAEVRRLESDLSAARAALSGASRA